MHHSIFPRDGYQIDRMQRDSALTVQPSTQPFYYMG